MVREQMKKQLGHISKSVCPSPDFVWRLCREFFFLLKIVWTLSEKLTSRFTHSNKDLICIWKKISKNFFLQKHTSSVLFATWSRYGLTNLLLYCVLSYCTVYIANLRLKQTRNYHTCTMIIVFRKVLNYERVCVT